MKGLIYVLMKVILMQTLSECRGFEESCVLIHSLFLDFPPEITELQNAYGNELVIWCFKKGSGLHTLCDNPRRAVLSTVIKIIIIIT